MVKLEQYNRVVFAILGTVALAGLVVVGGLFAALHGWSSAHAVDSSVRAPDTTRGGEKVDRPAAPSTRRPEPGRPFLLDDSGDLLIPLLSEESTPATKIGWLKSDDQEDSIAFVNFVVLDAKSGSTQRVLPKDGRVVAVHRLDAPNRSPQRLLLSIAEPTSSGDVDPDASTSIVLWQDRPPSLRHLGPEHADLLDHVVSGDGLTLTLRVRVEGKDEEDGDDVQLWRVNLADADRGKRLQLPR